MDDAPEDQDELSEATVFLCHFNDLEDTRQPGKVIYPLDEVLLPSLLAVLAGAETFTDIARFGDKKLSLLRRFRPFHDGTPPHDRIGDIFAALDAEQFQRCFVAWVASITGIPAGVIAIEGAIVTIDAMGCQREIARAILDKKADYVLALKGNQGSLREDVEVFAAEQQAKGFADTAVSQETMIDGDHGRIETRTTTVINDVGWLQKRHDWPGLQAVVVVDSRREINGKTEREKRFYLTSLVMSAALLGPVVRSHWAIENSLHWVMDMIFRDDECRVRTDHAPANFTTIKHMAHNLLRTAPSKDSLRLRRKVAAWDDEFLAKLVTR